jgi:hypothetical protein
VLNDILFLIGLDRETLALAIICALSGTLVLANSMRRLGIFSVLAIFLALFTGAIAASGTLQKLGWTLEGHLERQLLACFGGMAVVAIVIIWRMPRGSGR